MKNAKNLFAVVLTLLFVACLFTACGKSESDTTTTTEATTTAASTAKPVTDKATTTTKAPETTTKKTETTTKAPETTTQKETTTKAPETTTEALETTTEKPTPTKAPETTTEIQPVYTDRNETVYATDIVNIRTGPDTSYSSVGTLDADESVKRTAIGDNGWSKVSYDGATYYVYSEYLTTEKPVIETTTQPTTTKPTTTEPTTTKPVTEENTTKKPATTESTTKNTTTQISDSSVIKTSGGIKLYPITSETAKQIANSWSMCFDFPHYEGKSADNKTVVVYVHTPAGWTGLDEYGTKYDSSGKIKICEYCGLKMGEKNNMCGGDCAVVFH